MPKNIEKLRSYRSFRISIDPKDQVELRFYRNTGKEQIEISPVEIVNMSLTGIGIQSTKHIDQDGDFIAIITFKGKSYHLGVDIARKIETYNDYGEIEKFYYGLKIHELEQKLKTKFIKTFIASFSKKRLKGHLLKLLSSQGMFGAPQDDERISLLLSLRSDMMNFVDLEEFISGIIYECKRISSADYIQIFLSSENDSYKMKEHCFTGEEISKKYYDVYGSLLSPLISEGRVINSRINTFNNRDKHLKEFSFFSEFINFSYLAVPILDEKGESVGVIQVVKNGNDYFDQRSEETFLLLANILSDFRLDQKKITRDNHISSPQKFVLLGRGESVRVLREFVQLQKNSSENIFISGESGTGKELLGHVFHADGKDSSMACVDLYCHEIFSKEELHATLYGAENSVGKLELCAGGTLVLQNLDALNLQLQRQLYSYLEDESTIVRVIATSKSNLDNHSFISQLLGYFEGGSIFISPLRERLEDFDDLFHCFLQKSCDAHGVLQKQVSPEVLTQFKEYSWPGNLRELESAVERLVLYNMNIHYIYKVSNEVVPIFDSYFYQRKSYRKVLTAFQDNFSDYNEEELCLLMNYFFIKRFFESGKTIEEMTYSMNVEEEEVMEDFKKGEEIFNKYLLMAS